MRSYLTRIGALTATGILLVALPMCAKDTSRADSIPGPTGVDSDEEAARAALADTPLGHVLSHDVAGNARVIVGAKDKDHAAVLQVSAETASRVHLSRHAKLLGLDQSAVRGAVVKGTHAIGGGASVVQYEQQMDGLEVFHSRASVLVDASKNLVSMSSTLHPAAVGHKAVNFPLSAESVVANVYAAHFGLSLGPSAVRDVGLHDGSNLRDYAITVPANSPRMLDTTVRRVLFPEAGSLLAAYHVEFIGRAAGSKEDDGYSYVIDAKEGRLLYKASITASESFKYKVWADDKGVPTDGPYVDSVPNMNGPQPWVEPAYAEPILVTQEGFNTNPDGKADPWLPAAATTTFGNNARAYSDRNDTHVANDAGVVVGDGYDEGVDIVATLTGDPSARTFDRKYDVTKAPNSSDDQVRAAVTQLFYVNNWLHDYWYDSGFNEAAGNAQLSNFGRGGAENDPLRLEAQDGAEYNQANNANMSTPSDGRSPRMQMYVWSNVPNRKLETTPAILIEDGLGAAAYSPETTTFNLTDEVVLSDDGTSTLACGPMNNVTGKIAVIDRGGAGACAPLLDKMKRAQASGATGVVLVNNTTGVVALGGAALDVKIPILSLSLRDGQKLKTLLAQRPVTARMFRGAEGPLHDGTIDNSIIAHEWGHYFHHRLVLCGSQSCGGMSEGWGDFNALFMSIHDNDELEGPAYPAAQYAVAGRTAAGALYFGIRRAPYSTDVKKNPFTFGHTRKSSTLPTTAPLWPNAPDMNQVHNVGQVWAETLFESYVNLQKSGKARGLSFDANKRRFANYLVAGMKATVVEPTFVEQRDAILGAVWAGGDREDFKAIAEGFAKRGLGSGAIAPPASSVTLDEGVENFDYKGNLALVSAKLEEVTPSCDGDGVLDAGEAGKLVIQVKNSGWLALTNTKVTVGTTDPNVTFDKTTETVASLDPVTGVTTLTFGLQVSKGAPFRSKLPIAIRVTNDDAIPKALESTMEVLYNFDDAPKTSKTDTVESDKLAWTFAQDPKSYRVWGREGTTVDHVWHGNDIGTTSDESLTSPDLVVAPTGDFTISFKHRYRFEYTPKTATAAAIVWDAGVIELSDDGGNTWKDISTYAGGDPGYPETITAGNGNGLELRKAFGGDSRGYPNYTGLSLNLGNSLAGKTVKLRFRISTDGGAGAPGWDIDDIAFGGITNSPFSSVVDQPDVACAISGDAGVDSGSVGSLDAGTNGQPQRFTNDDSTCAVGAIGRTSRTGTSGLAFGLIGGLLMLARRRLGGGRSARATRK